MTQSINSKSSNNSANGRPLNSKYDVVVIGGGAAGLSAALTLGRARRSVLVVDAGKPRNAPASHVHNYLGRESTPPLELLAIGRAEVAGYGGEVVSGAVIAAERIDPGHFRVTLEDGSTVEARRLVIATGLVDELPDIPGVAERWGRDVLTCPYCHGWEVRDQAIGVLGSLVSMHQAQLWRQWSANVSLFLHMTSAPGDLDGESLAARGVSIVEGEVERLEVENDRLTSIRMRDGRVFPLDVLVIGPKFNPRPELMAALGLETTEQPNAGQAMGRTIAADPTGATTVPGIWVAGNVSNMAEQVIGAAASGTRVAAAINFDLIAEETRVAVANLLPA